VPAPVSVTGAQHRSPGHVSSWLARGGCSTMTPSHKAMLSLHEILQHTKTYQRRRHVTECLHQQADSSTYKTYINTVF